MLHNLKEKTSLIAFSVVGAIFVATAFMLFDLRGAPTTTHQLTVGDNSFSVAVADSRVERFRGLSNYRRLGDKQGMWFSFDNPDEYGFVMRDMNFPIDIIWVDSEKTVVGAVERAQPESYPETVYKPPEPVQYVLELSAGSVDQFGIEAGDQIEGPS